MLPSNPREEVPLGSVYDNRNTSSWETTITRFRDPNIPTFGISFRHQKHKLGFIRFEADLETNMLKFIGMRVNTAHRRKANSDTIMETFLAYADNFDYEVEETTPQRKPLMTHILGNYGFTPVYEHSTNKVDILQPTIDGLVQISFGLDEAKASEFMNSDMFNKGKNYSVSTGLNKNLPKSTVHIRTPYLLTDTRKLHEKRLDNAYRFAIDFH